MAAVSIHLPWWEGVMLLGGVIGFIQWFSRRSWKFVRNQADKHLSLAKK
jgi:hypothetical protein